VTVSGRLSSRAAKREYFARARTTFWGSLSSFRQTATAAVGSTVSGSCGEL